MNDPTKKDRCDLERIGREKAAEILVITCMIFFVVLALLLIFQIIMSLEKYWR